jgi:hypothetical protein
MGLSTDVRVRQPAANDLVGKRFVVVGVSNGLEGTIGVRLVNAAGKVLASTSAQSQGGMVGVGEFSTHVTVASPPRAGARLTCRSSVTTQGCPTRGRRPGSTRAGCQ